VNVYKSIKKKHPEKKKEVGGGGGGGGGGELSHSCHQHIYKNTKKKLT